jgi:hypothetical protein
MAVTLNNLDVTSSGALTLTATGANAANIRTNGVDRIHVTSAGNVGIGTTSPAKQLTIQGDVGGEIRLRNNANTAFLDLFCGGGAGSGIGTNSTFPLLFKTAETERARIDAVGKILAATGGGWVGTVAQAGLSSVIERGANANGEYVKFADGTLICITTTTSALSGGSLGNFIPGMYFYSITLTIPVSYTGTLTGYGGLSVDSMTTGLVHNADNGTYYYQSQGLNPVGTLIRVVWIGRWY